MKIDIRLPRRRYGILVAVALVLLTAGLSEARQPGRGGNMPGGRQELLTERLDLTAEQQETIAGIKEESAARNLELRKELMRLRNQLAGEMLKDDPAESEVLSLTDQIGDLRNQMDANRMKCRLEVRKQLTPEQRDKMLVMNRRHGKDGGEGSPRRGFRGKGRTCGRECERGDNPRLRARRGAGDSW